MALAAVCVLVDAVRSPLVGMAVAPRPPTRQAKRRSTDATPTDTASPPMWLDGGLLADRGVLGAIGALVGPGGAPSCPTVEGARCAPPSLGDRHHRPAHSTSPWPPTCSTRRRAATAWRTWWRCSWGWRSTPGRGSRGGAARRSRARAEVELSDPDAARQRAGLGPRCSRPTARRARCGPGSSACTTRSSGPSCACSPAWRWRASRVDADELRRIADGARRRVCTSLEALDPRAARARRSTSTRLHSCGPCCTTGSGSPRGARPRPVSPPNAATLEKLRGQHPIVDTCCATARWRSCAPPTASPCWPRSPTTGASTPLSTRPWRAPGGCRRTGPTSTTSPCAPRRGGGCAAPSSPPTGYRLLVADYDQIELRVIAHLSGDPGLVAAFAERTRHPPRDGGEGVRRGPRGRHLQPSAAGRRWSPTGSPTAWSPTGSPSGLSIETGRGRRRSSTPISPLSRSCVPRWTGRWPRPAARATPRRSSDAAGLFPICTRRTADLRMAAERQAMNAGIQGLAADLFKVALVRLDGALEEGGFVAARASGPRRGDRGGATETTEERSRGDLVPAVLAGVADEVGPRRAAGGVGALGHSWADAKGDPVVRRSSPVAESREPAG